MPDPIDEAGLRRRISRARVACEREGASPESATAEIWDAVLAGSFGPVPAGRGWFHEAIGIPDKDAVFARARDGIGITGADLAAATRVYTPPAIVRFLLQNTVGAMWCAAHPDSPLRADWPLLIPEAVDGAACAAWSARDLRVADPCCGAGAFLVAAAPLLADLIQDEEGTAGDPAARREALAHVVTHAIWGADIDATAVAIARETLTELADGAEPTHLSVVDAPAGILDPDVWSGEAFDVVVTNPPYVGTRQMDRALVARLTELDGGTVSDLAVMVQRRAWDLVAEGGRCGTITPAGWLNDHAAAPLRRRMLAEGGPRAVAPLGQRVFDQAPLVFCALTVLERSGPSGSWQLLRPADADEEGLIAAAGTASVVDGGPLRRLAVPPFAPQVPVRLLTAARPTVSDFFTTFDGAWTGSHRRDVRAWWELPDDTGWVRVSGGQGREGWAAGTAFRMRAEHVGDQPDRTGLVEYPRVAGGWLCARAAEDGTAARAGVVTFRPRSDEAHARTAELLAVFNTRIGTAWLRTLTSGLNFNPGYAGRIPLGSEPPGDDLRAAVGEAVALRRELIRRDPTSDEFEGIPWTPDDVEDRLASVVVRVDALTADHLGLSQGDWLAMEAPRPPRRRWTATEDAWLVAALRCAGVRWPTDPEGVTWEIDPIALTALADASAALAADAGMGDDSCVRGNVWVTRNLARYLDQRFRRTAPVTVERGRLVPRAASADRGGRARPAKTSR